MRSRRDGAEPGRRPRRPGVGQDERVAIVSPNAARFLVSLFGVSACGRILVP
jgi:acyl-CoA synthetase (AMP-forming)/AMP-acid ligase II